MNKKKKKEVKKENKKEIKEIKMTAKAKEEAKEVKEEKVNEIKEEVEIMNEEDIKDKDLKFKRLSPEKYSQYKIASGSLGFFEFRIPNLGYMYCRGLNVNELKDSLTMDSKEARGRRNQEHILRDIFENIMEYPDTSIDKRKIINEIVYEKPALSAMLIARLQEMSFLLANHEDVTFRQL